MATDDVEECDSERKTTLYCSFCGKSQHEVRKLIAGPTVFICDECTELCDDILIEHSFPGRVVVRIKVPRGSDYDDFIHKSLVEYLDDRFRDLDLKYENRSIDVGNNRNDDESLVVFSFKKIYGDYDDREGVALEYARLRDELASAVGQISVLTTRFMNESQQRAAVERELANLKSEYFEFLRENVKLKESSDIRAVLFLDIAGFSKLEFSERYRIVDFLRGIVPPLMRGKGANDINMWGDAIVANFEDPNQAVECAAKFRRHLNVEQLETRMGISWGQVRFCHNPATGRMDIDGPVVDFAARLESMAPLGEIVLSKDFGSLEIAAGIGSLIPTVLKVKKPFAAYEVDDEIDAYTLFVASN